jgi:mRNA-degrading endonuclease toxin of MazEF toxin-antitoxin module
VPLPEPHPGLVISYSYLWFEEHARRLHEGRKDRPCAIVVARRIARKKTIVTVVPVTHSPPEDKSVVIEIPPDLKRHLGLDPTRSWIVLTEINEFLWPGPDLRPVGRHKPREFAYGVLPPAFFRQLRDQLLTLARDRRLRRVARSN